MGVPVLNPSAVKRLLELLPQQEQVAACRPGDKLGMTALASSPSVEQSTQN